MVVSDKVGKPPIAWFMKWEDGGLGLGIFMLFQDTIHALDLGVTGHVLANVLTYMVESDLMGEGATRSRRSRRCGARSKQSTRSKTSPTRFRISP